MPNHPYYERETEWNRGFGPMPQDASMFRGQHNEDRSRDDFGRFTAENEGRMGSWVGDWDRGSSRSRMNQQVRDSASRWRDDDRDHPSHWRDYGRDTSSAAHANDRNTMSNREPLRGREDGASWHFQSYGPRDESRQRFNSDHMTQSDRGHDSRYDSRYDNRSDYRSNDNGRYGQDTQWSPYSSGREFAGRSNRQAEGAGHQQDRWNQQNRDWDASQRSMRNRQDAYNPWNDRSPRDEMGHSLPEADYQRNTMGGPAGGMRGGRGRYQLDNGRYQQNADNQRGDYDDHARYSEESDRWRRY